MCGIGPVQLTTLQFTIIVGWTPFTTASAALGALVSRRTAEAMCGASSSRGIPGRGGRYSVGALVTGQMMVQACPPLGRLGV